MNYMYSISGALLCERVGYCQQRSRILKLKKEKKTKRHKVNTLCLIKLLIISFAFCRTNRNESLCLTLKATTHLHIVSKSDAHLFKEFLCWSIFRHTPISHVIQRTLIRWHVFAILFCRPSHLFRYRTKKGCIRFGNAQRKSLIGHNSWRCRNNSSVHFCNTQSISFAN